MESQLDDFGEEEALKPALLKVLCILTFIGSSALILINIGSYSSADKTAQMMSHVRENMRQKDSTFNNDSSMQPNHRNNRKGNFFRRTMMGSASEIMTADNFRKTAIGAVISAILTLIGAILMWQLKRSGFYIYVVGTMVSLLVPFFLYGFNTMSFGISFFSGFFGLLFTALYALNIKSLR